MSTPSLAPRKTTGRRDQARLDALRTRPLTVAALWPKVGHNLGTVARTCDALRATLAVPRSALGGQAVKKGMTLGRAAPVEWLDYADPIDWLRGQKAAGADIVGAEQADGAILLPDVRPTDRPTVLVLGNEGAGIPARAWPLLDYVIEIPMQGAGGSLNVACAASLILYKLAGLS